MNKIIFVNSKEHRDSIAEEYGEDNLLLKGNTSSFVVFKIKDTEQKIYMNKNLFNDIDKERA